MLQTDKTDRSRLIYCIPFLIRLSTRTNFSLRGVARSGPDGPAIERHPYGLVIPGSHLPACAHPTAPDGLRMQTVTGLPSRPVSIPIQNISYLFRGRWEHSEVTRYQPGLCSLLSYRLQVITVSSRYLFMCHWGPSGPSERRYGV